MDLRQHLNRFISQTDGFAWRRLKQGDRLEMASGHWKSGTWNHRIAIVPPRRLAVEDTAVLYVTGGDLNDVDLAEAGAIADRSGLRVALLFHIPNQPLFDLWEDDLIAHTFEQYIDTGDPDWPLLFPMARAAIRAMDAIQGASPEIRRFVVIGASKRGWTTWLSACTGDPRICGIAPMVIDNLNFPAQMAHQLASWGAYSEQIEDYTSRELQAEMDSERGAELVTMMDPINYVDRIECPILIVNGANDRYWTVDALSLYWDLLPPSKRCVIVPNAGHLLGDKRMMVETVSAFALASANGALLPDIGVSPDWRHVEAPEADSIRCWAARSETLDFRDSQWEVIGAGPPLPLDSSRDNWAEVVEGLFTGPTGSFSITTPVKVTKRTG